VLEVELQLLRSRWSGLGSLGQHAAHQPDRAPAALRALSELALKRG